ncbi:MAG: hypothetical protein M5U26_14160 [Planctomycetota bacterium]|nr:hypothetical protein [Planctomycetota bacterium]
MSIAGVRYRFSGQLGSGLAVLPLAALGSALLCGLAYGYINVYNPLIYIQALVTFGTCWLLGMAVSRAARSAKVRNPGFVAGMSLLAGLLGLYAVWTVFEFAFLQRFAPAGVGMTPSLATCLVSPGMAVNFADTLAQAGWWTLGRSGSPVSGILLWIFWAVEAACIVGGTVYLAHTDFVKGVFCEDCGQWCKETQDVARGELSTDAQMLAGLKEGDLERFAALPPPLTGEKSYFRLDQRMCEGCGNLGTYQVHKIVTTVDKNKKEETKTEQLTPNLLLTPDSVQALGGLISRGKTRAQAKKPFAAPPGGDTPAEEAPPAAPEA